MSYQILNSCVRALGKRSAVHRAKFGYLANGIRAASTSTPDQTPPPSSTSPRLSFGIGFFNPSHPPSQHSKRWPTTQESAQLRLLLLRRNSSGDAIYDAYLRLMNDPLHRPLPRAIHQLVLRRVVTPLSAIRPPNFSLQPDRFVTRQETRLREVIFQMRAEGFEPTMTDYHFVLEQMAAMGHQRAAYNVYLEIVKSAHKPTERTIALTLLALVRRHKMRIYDDHIGAVKLESHNIAGRLLGDLLGLQQDLSAEPISPMCLDLACRVFKISGSLDKFLSILKSGYGVDISQPDHLPLEFIERVQAIQAKSVSTSGEPSSVREIPRFSTHTLNTTLDMLGKSGKVLEMVSAFEVLTNPLPASVRIDGYQYDTWEDDEPENASLQSPAPARNWLADYVPSAMPNTASLAFMIKHTVDSAKFDLCKHYLLLAIHLDRVSDYYLRQQLRAALRARREHAAAVALESRSNLPSSDDTPPLSPTYTDPPIDIPRVAVSYEIFTKVWGLANQKAHMRSLRGLVRTVRRVIRRKRKDIEVYRIVLRAVPTLAAPVSTRLQADLDREEPEDGEIPAWLLEMIEERPPERRQFSLAAHVALLEAETEKLEAFWKYGIPKIEHSSARIQAEMERKEKRRAEAARAAEELVAQAGRKKERQKEQKPESAEPPGSFAPA